MVLGKKKYGDVIVAEIQSNNYFELNFGANKTAYKSRLVLAVWEQVNIIDNLFSFPVCKAM